MVTQRQSMGCGSSGSSERGGGNSGRGNGGREYGKRQKTKNQSKGKLSNSKPLYHLMMDTTNWDMTFLIKSQKDK